MAKVFIEETTLTAIGDAIRNKTGSTDLIAPGDMAAEISGIEAGGGDLPEEAFVITGNCENMFNNNKFNWFLTEYGDRITTKDIESAMNMFRYTKVTEIPFALNFKSSGYVSGSYSYERLFASANNLESIGDINGMYFYKVQSMFENCYNLKQIPNFVNCLPMGSDSSVNAGNHTSGKIFASCYSLKEISPEVLSYFNYPGNNTSTYPMYNSCFNSCYSLGELLEIPVAPGTFTSNAFQGTFNNCTRLARITFETNEDGTPKIANWKNQIIDLTQRVGYALGYEKYILDYNSGITEDNRVSITGGLKLPESYTSLFTDGVMTNKDWYTPDNEHSSRYNKWSAIETINSLPDTSAYLAANGGTNTIKFKENSGHGTVHKTDGTAAVPLTSTVPNSFLEKNNFGGIYNLSEEEIAVAAAKGWTVALV